MAYRSFEDLEVWRKSSRLAVEIVEAFRDCRDFGLRDQVLKSAISVPSNIAEGAERGSNKEFIRFLHIAKGSAAELRTQIYIASELDILPSAVAKDFIDRLKTVSSQLQALIASLKPNT